MSDRPVKVVLVEKDPLTAQRVDRIVRSCSGFLQVASFCDSAELSLYLGRCKADLLLFGFDLPCSDVFESLFSLRCHDYNVDCIVFSSDNSPSTIQKAFRLGVFDFLVKPFGVDRFRRSLVAYRRYRRAFEDYQDGLSQSDLDENRFVESLGASLPKGLHRSTLKAVEDCLSDASCGLSASDIAGILGLSRVTVRRYLEFLRERGHVELCLDRSRGGRPGHLFSACPGEGNRTAEGEAKRRWKAVIDLVRLGQIARGETDLLGRALDLVSDRLALDAGSAWTFEAAAGRFSLRASRNLTGDRTAPVFADPLLSLKGPVVAAPDSLSGIRSARLGFPFLLGVPFCRGGNLLGFLELGALTFRKLTEEDLLFLETLGLELGNAVTHFRAEEALRRRESR